MILCKLLLKGGGCYGHMGLSVGVVCVLRVLSAFALIGLDPQVPGWGCVPVNGIKGGLAWRDAEREREI